VTAAVCGIAGVFSYKPIDEAVVRRMNDSLRHRGPDDSGVHIASVNESCHIALAHRRLSILDLSPLGHQPMVSPSGRFAISYNGEVYNFKEIRQQCEQHGFSFRGGSDTEVILAAIEQWGVEEAVRKFVGMFALAIWDNRDATLFLCRDRLGKKPLYYTARGDTCAFGSELKAICALPSFHREIDRNVLALLVRYNLIPSPWSIYKDVFKVPPGAVVAVQQRGGSFEATSSAYWSLADVAARGQAGLIDGEERDVVDQFEALLSDAVGIRMIADVPLGAFLSGGIDSSTVVALMQKQSSIPVKTFSIGNADKKHDEAAYAKAVAHHLGTEHTEFYITGKDILDVVPLLPQMFDEPLPDSSQIPTFLVSKLSRTKVTVALTGDGGDEVFGGYARYRRVPQVWKALAAVPYPLRKAGGRFLAGKSPGAGLLVSAAASFLRSQGRVCNSDQVRSYIAATASVASPQDLFHRYLCNELDPAGVVVGAGAVGVPLLSPGMWPVFRNFESTMMYVDMLNFLSEDILVKVDRASMAVSLETRIPILDHRVVEFAWRLPLKYKIRGTQSKWILRQVLHRYVPESLVNRPKMGFSIPVGKWLKNELRPWAEEMLSEARLKRQGYFAAAPIRRKWLEHLSGQRDWHFYLWNILTFQAWLEAQR
jgi:asparagine synthase (glutamine-hydrolysing)